MTATPKRTVWFYLMLALLMVCIFLSVNTDLAEYSQHQELHIPAWFFTVIFSVDFLMAASVVLIFFYRKTGAVILPIAVFAHFLLHQYYLSTFLYSDLNLLFVYFAAGLVMIVPRWKDFRY